MSPTISTHALRKAIALLEPDGEYHVEGAREEVRAELERALKPKRIRSKPKSKAERDETAEIRDAVFIRAAGLCEACRVETPTEWHHVFGRVRVPQSVTNTVALCHSCHHAATNSKPSAAFWLRTFRDHFIAHGYANNAERVKQRLEGMVAIRNFEQTRHTK